MKSPTLKNKPSSNATKANKNRGVAFLVLSGLGKGLISWYFWLLMTLLAIGFIVAKYAKLSDWQAKKELERISRQHNQS